MRKKFDLVILGTGTAGSTAASKCRAAGWEIAIVDSRPFGGTCALRGCDPKKVLVGASDVIDRVRRMKGKGVTGDDVRIDWSELMRFKRTFVESTPSMKEKSFAKAGIAPFHGRARFIDATTIEVGSDELEGRYVLIATGAMPTPLRFPGAHLLTDSTRFLDLDELPKRIVFVGGGYVSLELAHVSARAGAEVHVVHRGRRPLERFDADLVMHLVKATRDLGVQVHLESEVQSMEKTERGVRVVASKGISIDADLAVHGAGRVPEIDDLGLDQAGIRRNPLGIAVNEYLQSTSNPAVYAAGDAAGTGAPKLTPVSSMDGHVAASNMLEGNHQKPDYSEVPSAVFTVPTLAGVGLLENEAKEQGLAFDVHFEDTSGWYSSRRVGMKHAAHKVLVEKPTGRLLGAHVLGPDAEEIINIFAVAIRARMTAADVKKTIFAYPTGASDLSYLL
jgi:glutathione reductase (NADPH)